MSQSYQPLVGTDTLTASRTIINNDLDALLTSFAGTAFPTVNIAVGMTCYRTDLQKTYRLRSTGPATWVQSDNLNNSLNYNRFQYVSTAGQAAYTGADKNGLTLTYTVGFVEVNIDGVWLMPDDFTATDGTSVTINRAQYAGQNVYIQSLAPFNVVDVLTQSQNGADILDKAKFRANIGVTKKNYIINGGMQISQEWGTTSPGVINGSYPVDQFAIANGSDGALTAQQVASSTPGGSTNRLRVVVTTADAAVAASNTLFIYQPIEGVRASDLLFGASTAKAITVQFGVKAPAGTYCVAIRNAYGATRSYITEITITGGEANTEVVKYVTIPGDITGTWAKDNSLGLVVSWCLMCGTTYQTTANAWQAGSYLATSNQFNFMGTLGNTFELFDVSLTEGTQAPPFQLPDFDEELRKCKRYWQKSYDYATAIGAVTAAGAFIYYIDNIGAGFHSTSMQVFMGQSMRTTPTVTSYSTTTGTSGKIRDTNSGADVTANVSQIGQTGFSNLATSFASTTVLGFQFHWTANARM